MIGAETWMGQERKRFKMPLEDEMLLEEDGRYLVGACPA